MTPDTTSDDKDWLVPAILVAVVVGVALIIGIIAGVRATGSDDQSVAGQLERWSSCLRSQGANVPLVESLRDGGFRVTVDGSLVDGGIDTEALGPALDACQDDAPEGVRKVMAQLEGMSESPFDGHGTDIFEFGEARGESLGRIDAALGRRDRAHRNRSEVCERIEHGDVDVANIPPRVARACRRSS